MLPKTLPAKTVVQNVQMSLTKFLLKNRPKNTNIKKDGTKILSKNCTRKNSRSKCPFWKGS